MRRKRVRFRGSEGAELVGRLEQPEGPPRAYALFAHCFTCSKDLKAAGWISRALVDRGIGVLRFDFTGIGESAGDFADTDFRSNLEDLVAAADFLRAEYRAPQILIGHSLGGAAVLAAASRVPEAQAVATLAAPSDTEDLRERLLSRAPELEETGEAEIRIGPRTFRIQRKLLDDLAEDHLSGAIGALDRALLVFHSPVDDVVGIDNARRIYEAAKHPKSFISLDDADHLLSREADARYVGEVLAAWAGRYLEEPVDEREDRESPEGEIVVVGGAEGYGQEISVRRHVLSSDEPVSVGGEDTGPTPYELLLASLGACTSMTLRMYADRKKWPLEGIRVALEHAKIHAKDCAHCDTEKGRIDRIRRDIEVRGDLSDEQRERLLEIADRCPVHRTLTGEIDIASRLV
jgi:uncharacterized OsmC-like protein/alpha/beta superfamily hydrolase